MSPTLLARLRAAEHMAQHWARTERAYWMRNSGPAFAAYYGARCCWPDARTLVAKQRV